MNTFNKYSNLSLILKFVFKFEIGKRKYIDLQWHVLYFKWRGKKVNIGFTKTFLYT